jgi:hypothetical protein
MPGGIPGLPCPSRLRSLINSDNIKKGCAQQKLRITDPTSRQRGRLTSTNSQLCKNNYREKGKNWSGVSDGCLTPRQTGRLTVGRNITLTFALTWVVQWLWLPLSKGPNRVGVSFRTWGRKQIQFPKRCDFSYLEFRTMDKSLAESQQHYVPSYDFWSSKQMLNCPKSRKWWPIVEWRGTAWYIFIDVSKDFREEIKSAGCLCTLVYVCDDIALHHTRTQSWCSW